MKTNWSLLKVMMSLFTLLLFSSLLSGPSKAQSDWTIAFREELVALDDEFSGNFGVYVKHLEQGNLVNYFSSRPWYLASTTKIPVALALMEAVEAGEISLDEEMVLKSSDWVDGSGELLRRKPGERFTIRSLLRHMLERSDSTATDMLIRKVGLPQINKFVQTTAQGFWPMTSILDVRYGGYGFLHPRAKELTNLDFLALKRIPIERRADAFAKKLNIMISELNSNSYESAFEKYYEQLYNSSSLEGYGELLEKMITHQIVSPEHTETILKHMENIKTGNDRIKAGLPKNVTFAQKTGTQIGRVCNVGIIRSSNRRNNFIIAACAEKFKNTGEGEAVLKYIGKALTQSGAFNNF